MNVANDSFLFHLYPHVQASPKSPFPSHIPQFFSHTPLLPALFLLNFRSTSLLAWTFQSSPNCSFRQADPSPSIFPSSIRRPSHNFG